MIYMTGFVFVYLLGERINANPFHFLAFIGPLFVVTGVIGMLWTTFSNASFMDN